MIGLANKANNKQIIVPMKNNTVGAKLSLLKNVIIPKAKKAVAKIIKKMQILIKASLTIIFFNFSTPLHFT